MQVIMIYSHSVATDFVKHKSRESGVEVYTLHELSENIGYLIKDLRPSVIIISSEILSSHSDLFNDSVKESGLDVKVLELSKENEKEMFEDTFPVPFEPDQLIYKILELGNKNG